MKMRLATQIIQIGMYGSTGQLSILVIPRNIKNDGIPRVTAIKNKEHAVI